MWVRSFNSFKSKFLDGLKSAKINCPSDCSCNLICLTNSTCVGCLKRKPQNEAFSEPGKSHYNNRERGEAVLFLFSFLHHNLLCVVGKAWIFFLVEHHRQEGMLYMGDKNGFALYLCYSHSRGIAMIALSYRVHSQRTLQCLDNNVLKISLSKTFHKDFKTLSRIFSLLSFIML